MVLITHQIDKLIRLGSESPQFANPFRYNTKLNIVVRRDSDGVRRDSEPIPTNLIWYKLFL